MTFTLRKSCRRHLSTYLPEIICALSKNSSNVGGVSKFCKIYMWENITLFFVPTCHIVTLHFHLHETLDRMRSPLWRATIALASEVSSHMQENGVPMVCTQDFQLMFSGTLSFHLHIQCIRRLWI